VKRGLPQSLRKRGQRKTEIFKKIAKRAAMTGSREAIILTRN
jgi:hypothetical protein